MRITQIEQILEIDRSASISKASRNLFISQPALSTMLQEFETEIGVKIFERTKSGVTPTSDGVQILNSMRTIMQEIKYIQSFSEKSEELTGDFTLAIGAAYEFLYTDIIQCFKENFPKANLKTVNYSPNIADHVSKGFVDLALLPFYDEKGTYYSQKAISSQYKNITILPLDTIQTCVVVNKTHPKSACETIYFSDLIQEQLILGKQHDLWQIQKYLKPEKYPITDIERSTVLELLDRSYAVLLDSYCNHASDIYRQRYSDYKVIPVVQDILGFGTSWETYFIYRNTCNKLQRLFIHEVKTLLRRYDFLSV